MRNINNNWYPLCAPGKSANNTHLLVSSICGITVGNFDIKYCALQRVFSFKSSLIVTGDYHRALKYSNKKIEKSTHKGKFAAFSGDKFFVVNTCPTLELIFVKCSSPECGRKGPASLKDASGTIATTPSSNKRKYSFKKWKMYTHYYSIGIL